MQAFFLEEPLYLVPVLVLIQLFLVAHWLRSRTGKSARIAAVSACLFAGLVGLQAVVTTDRERIRAVCEQLTRAVEHADPVEFSRLLCEETTTIRRTGGPLDKEGLLDRFQALLHVYRVEDARLRSVEVEVTDSHAKVDFRAGCRVVSPSEQYPSVLSHWKLEFERVGGDQPAGGEWKLKTIRQGTLEPVGLDLLSEVF